MDKIIVSITESQIILDAFRSAPNKSISDAISHWFKYMMGQDPMEYEKIETIVVDGWIRGNGLALMLQKALDQLDGHKNLSVSKTSLEVLLGPSLSRVGVFEVTGFPSIKLSDSDLDAHADAWISQTWKLQAGEHVIRRIPIGKKGRHLITCTNKDTVETLGAVCANAGIRMTRCTPALAAELIFPIGLLRSISTQRSKALPGINDLTVSVFAERQADGQRSRSVQFAVFDRSGPKSIIRMWLPENGSFSQDSEISHVIERLRRYHRVAEFSKIDINMWPSPAN